MDNEVLRRSHEESPSFGRFFDPSSGLSKVVTEISGKYDLPLDDFDFTFSSSKSDCDTSIEASADEIFFDGRILTVYPVVKRGRVEERIDDLAMNFERLCLRSGPSSSTMESALESESYCDWMPNSAPQSPSQWRKSHSTGSAALNFKSLSIREIVFGRSHSDGKGKSNHVSAPGEKEVEKTCFLRSYFSQKSVAKRGGKKGKRGMENRGAAKELDIVTAHRLYYGKGFTGGRKSRRSFLPYRPELFSGFFSNGKKGFGLA